MSCQHEIVVVIAFVDRYYVTYARLYYVTLSVSMLAAYNYTASHLIRTPRKNWSPISFADPSQPITLHFRYLILPDVFTRRYNTLAHTYNTPEPFLIVEYSCSMSMTYNWDWSYARIRNERLFGAALSSLVLSGLAISASPGALWRQSPAQ